MGSLALAYGVKGLGQGLIRGQEQRAKTKAAEEQGARDIQLQRQRDKAARERTEMQIAADKEARKEEYGYKAQELRDKIEAQSSENAKQQAHEIEVEKMRQQAKANLEQMRIDVKEPMFKTEVIEATNDTQDLQGNVIPGRPRQVLIKDQMTGLAYQQKNIGGRPVFVSDTQSIETTAPLVEAGEKLIPWLTSAPNRQEQIDRLFQFQRLFRYVPPEYFAAYGQGGKTRSTQRSVSETTTPANPPTTAPATVYE